MQFGAWWKQQSNVTDFATLEIKITSEVFSQGNHVEKNIDSQLWHHVGVHFIDNLIIQSRDFCFGNVLLSQNMIFRPCDWFWRTIPDNSKPQINCFIGRVCISHSAQLSPFTKLIPDTVNLLGIISLKCVPSNLPNLFGGKEPNGVLKINAILTNYCSSW